MSKPKLTAEKKAAIDKRFQEIEDGLGGITAEAVVADAKDPGSVLHDQFDWNDATAAHEHRLDQARRLLRIRVVVTVNERVFRAPIYVHRQQPDVQESGYVRTTRVVDDAAQAKAVLIAEFDRIESAIDRAMAVAGVLGMEKLLASLLDKLVQVRAAATGAQASCDDDEPEDANDANETSA